MKVNRANFTLIELMMVVVIIALLALVALPNFMNSRRNARNSTCIANLRIIEGAKALWGIETGAADTTVITENDLEPYFIKSTSQVTCPLGDNFEESYEVGSTLVLAVCKLDPTNHAIHP